MSTAFNTRLPACKSNDSVQLSCFSRHTARNRCEAPRLQTPASVSRNHHASASRNHESSKPRQRGPGQRWPDMGLDSFVFILAVVLIFSSASASPIFDRRVPAGSSQELPVSPHLDPRSIDAEATMVDHSSISKTSPIDTSREPSDVRRQPAPQSSLATDNNMPPQSNLPQPFDGDLGNNFTSSSCPTLFNSMLADQSFVSCVPVSLLLQTSDAWFEDLKSSSTLNPVLKAACAVDSSKCTSIMSSYATQFKSDSGCGADYALSNPNVINAYDGLTAYDAVYQATCLKDPSSGDYCFTDAATDNVDPGSIDLYYLPLGIGLPSTAQPRCNTCTQDVLSGFAVAAANSSSLLSTDYGDAARQVNTACGTGFVNVTVNTDVAGAASASRGRLSMWSFGATLLVTALWVL